MEIWTGIMQGSYMATGKDNHPIKYHDTYVMRQELLSGAHPDSTDILGQTPLMLAVKKGDYELAEMLLAAGADPNGCDHFGSTPLMFAWDCDLEIAKLLIRSGSDLNIENVFGDTAFDIARRNNQWSIVALLVKNDKRA
jgi:ankyrin repeat protein